MLQERLDGLQGSYEQATIDKDHQNSQTIQMRGGLAAAVSFTDALKNMEKTWSNELASIPLLKECVFSSEPQDIILVLKLYNVQVKTYFALGTNLSMKLLLTSPTD